jgi:EAL domain-containing protein (putative c-di-GMP-specific phosphodiesterase class I)
MAYSASVIVKVQNRLFLTQSYGASVANEVDREILARARAMCGASSLVVPVGPGCLEIVLEESTSWSIGTFNDNSFQLAVCLDALLLALSGGVSRDLGVSSLAVLTAEYMSSTVGLDVMPFALHVPASQASINMEIVADVSLAMREGRLQFAFQPVCNIRDHTRVLYWESLVRLKTDDSARIIFPGSFIPAMEKLGMMREFDRYVVKHIIDRLRANPDLRLGCNISAQSAIDDGWWTDVFGELERDSNLAARLVVEVTETAPLVVGKGRAFANRLRRTGCSLAIDDFGVKFGVLTSMELQYPDVVKIDGSFISRARKERADAKRLASIVSLAMEFCDTVVVEGVESAEDLQIASESGVHWVQGYYFGKPANMPMPLS